MNNMANVSSTAAPLLHHSLLRGSLGFTIVSLGGFAVWAFGGDWFYANIGEAGLYAVSAVVFLALSGLLLHPLMRGTRSVLQFYKIFLPAFLAYALIWSLAWFAMGFGLGEWIGSLGGAIAFAILSGWLLGSFRNLAWVCLILFLTHSAGYFLGGQIYYWSKTPSAAELLHGLSPQQISLVGMLGWGFLYGLGFGTGIGYAFFNFQNVKPNESTGSSIDRPIS
jgi:hypothetical protein